MPPEQTHYAEASTKERQCGWKRGRIHSVDIPRCEIGKLEGVCGRRQNNRFKGSVGIGEGHLIMTVGLYLKRKSACDPGFGRDREAAEVRTGAPEAAPKRQRIIRVRRPPQKAKGICDPNVIGCGSATFY